MPLRQAALESAPSRPGVRPRQAGREACWHTVAARGARARRARQQHNSRTDASSLAATAEDGARPGDQRRPRAGCAAVDDAARAVSLVRGQQLARGRYEHNAARVLASLGQSIALLTLLILRGPQTAAELRANAERLHRFADTSSVEGLPRRAGARVRPRRAVLALWPARRAPREARWAHLLRAGRGRRADVAGGRRRDRRCRRDRRAEGASRRGSARRSTNCCAGRAVAAELGIG